MPYKNFRIAILNMYTGSPSQGIPSIVAMISRFRSDTGWGVIHELFHTRLNGAVPDLSFDAYIATGGPGSPLDSANEAWEHNFFGFVESIKKYNSNAQGKMAPKHLFLICHSFQLMCRKYRIGKVSPRPSPSFGILPVRMTSDGLQDPLLHGLQNPFLASDNRNYQVIPNDFGESPPQPIKILCTEIPDQDSDQKPAYMAIRFDEYIFGTQFHPEADPDIMRQHLTEHAKKREIISKFGPEKYDRILKQIDDPACLLPVRDTVLPGFLKTCAGEWQRRL